MRPIDVDIACEKVKRFILRGYSITTSCMKSHVHRNAFLRRLTPERRAELNALSKKHYKPVVVEDPRLKNYEIATIIEAHIGGMATTDIAKRLDYRMHQVYGAINKYYGVPKSEFSDFIVKQSKINDEKPALPEVVGVAGVLML